MLQGGGEVEKWGKSRVCWWDAMSVVRVALSVEMKDAVWVVWKDKPLDVGEVERWEESMVCWWDATSVVMVFLLVEMMDIALVAWKDELGDVE